MHKGYCVVKKLVLNVRIKAFWYTNNINVQYRAVENRCKKFIETMLDLCKDSEEANTFIASEKYIDHYFDTKVKQILIISLKVLTTGKNCILYL